MNETILEKLKPEQKPFSDLPVGAIFIPFPLGTRGNRLIKIQQVENPQFGQINCLNFEWILQDLELRPEIEISQRIEIISKRPTFGGYVNFISDDCECTYLDQVNL